VLIHRLLEREMGRAPEAVHVRNVEALLDRTIGGTAETHLPGLVVSREYGTLRITRRQSGEGHCAGRQSASVSEDAGQGCVGPDAKGCSPAAAATFDFSAADGAADGPSTTSAHSLSVRPWRRGDRIVPAGKRAPRKVSDLFSAVKIPVRLRDTWPVVVAADGTVVWVPGVAAAAGFEPGSSEWTWVLGTEERME